MSSPEKPLKIAAIIQARAGSTRLPSKVLMALAGVPMLQRVVERVQRVTRFCPHQLRVVVATTTLEGDDAVAICAQQAGADVVRGPADDVLSRYHLAVEQLDRQGFVCDAVLRITADCPLLDPEVTARVVGEFAKGGCDYTSNTQPRTFPRGLDSEMVSRAALEIAHRQADQAEDREHVTLFVWRQPERFPRRNIADPIDRSNLRWTVDTPEDFELISRIYDALQSTQPAFTYADVVALLEKHPDWSRLNAHIEQKKLKLA